ncbi:MAG: sensor histidine kinase [Solirubrobacteraceae bacterium]
MPLRRRISIVAAATVAIAVAIAVIAAYFIVRGQLVGQVDSELSEQAAQVEANPYRALQTRFPELSAKAGGPIPYSQVVTANGRVPIRNGNLNLPGTYDASAVATGELKPYFRNITAGGTTLREYVFPLANYVYGGQAVAVQLARPLAAVENVLSTLRWILALLFLAVVALAAALGRLATRRVLTPLAEVTATAQAIAETEDLDRRIEIRQDDEVGQLAARFNEMLERLAASRVALDASVAAQRQLVADASHELRTPVTSLRTNIEVLLADPVLNEAERQRLLIDVVEQSEELSALVSDLIEVARGDVPSESMEDTRLDRLVEAALDRARRNSPEVEFTAALEPVAVTGNPERLTRAVNNLLDNASLHTDRGTAVEVTVGEAGVTVRDHGGGITAQDLPHIFDRFYRGEASRARHGSGLGLAIVRQVAEQHGGAVSAQNAPGGGAVFTLSLPTAPVADALTAAAD